MPVYPISIITSLSIAVGALMWRTDNFSSFTYETNRRNSVETTPIELSDWQLQNSDGETVYLSELSDKTLLVDFIFTRCPTVCRALGSRYQQLQRMINDSGNDQTALLSISIDPTFDTPERLSLYQEYYKGQKDTWYLARPVNENTLRSMTAETGLRVIPDEIGGFSHSDAIHLIQQQTLKKINAWDSTEWEYLISQNNVK